MSAPNGARPHQIFINTLAGVPGKMLEKDERMKNKSLAILFLLVLFVLRNNLIAAQPSEEKEWLTCATSEDCTSVELGCWYWQPVNKVYTKAMRDKYPPHCRVSLPPGPRPPAQCHDYRCINASYTGKYWKELESFRQVGFIDRRISSCLQEAGLDKQELSIYENADLRDPFIDLVGLLIEKDSLKQAEPLEVVIENAISCEEIVAKFRSIINKASVSVEKSK